ncbi:WD40 repeat-like protein [Martensiomyces pterosporus]|nr:WD40 repeat-like protein [Martensiomyces pterosporus]
MDVDVPDTERDSRKAFSDGSKPGRKSRIVDRVQLLRGHMSPVFLCAWNPAAANVLATGGGDGTARIWDLSRPKGDDGYMRVLKHEAVGDASVDVTAIVWNTQGSLLASACFNGQLRVWSSLGELKFTLAQRQVPIIAMRWNRKGNFLLSAYLDGSISLWDMQTGQLKQEFRGHSGSVLDVDWQDNATFASCSADKTVAVWRVGESSPVKTFTGHKSDVNSIKWHPSGKYLASSSDDGTVKVWTLSSDTPVQDFFGHAQQVYSVKWLPRADKAIVASASFDGTVRVWDVHSSSCLRVLSAHTEAVHCFAFSSDGRYLASGSFDKKVRIWSIKDGTLFKTFAAEDGIHDVQWAAKGRVAAAVANNVVAVFDPLG